MRTQILLGLALLCPSCHDVLRGDELRLRDGRVLVGTVLSRTDREVAFEVRSGKAVGVLRVAAGEVAALEESPLSRPAARLRELPSRPPLATAGSGPVSPCPTYFLVPLHGTVGEEIVAERIEAAFRVGARDPATIIILEIDSPGGDAEECWAITQLLGRYARPRSIAFVRSALSAAALIALTCDEIYMTPDAQIGAALGIRELPDGRIASVEEKFQSVLRSQGRRAAEIGGHSPLFAEKMMNPDPVLRVVTGAEGSKTVEDGPGDGRVLCARGRLLTLTASEAVDCGLAAGTALSLAELESMVPGAEGWQPSSAAGGSLMRAHAKAVAGVRKRFDDLEERAISAWLLAIEQNPFTKDYLFTLNGSSLTGNSVERWDRHRRACGAHLDTTDRALKDMLKLATKHPWLGLRAQDVPRSLSVVREVRKDLSLLPTQKPFPANWFEGR